MELNDSFTEGLLQRNKARKQFKSVKEKEISELTGRKRYALVEEQQVMDQDDLHDISRSPKRTSEELLDDSPKRQCLEKCEGSPSRQWPPQQCKSRKYEKENAPISENNYESHIPLKSAVKGLAALRKLDAPASNNGLPGQNEVNSPQTYMFSTNSTELCTGRKTRLANLAANINQWEDDLHRPTVPTNVVASTSKDCFNFNPSTNNTPENTFKATASVTFANSNLAEKDNKYPVKSTTIDNSSSLSPSKKTSDSEKFSHKLGMWDQAIKATLMVAEETKKSPSKTLKSIDEKREYVKKENSSDNKPSNDFVKNKLKSFGNKEDLNKSFEPSELPLSARKALFERGLNGERGNSQAQSFEPKLSVAQRAAMFENAASKSSAIKPVTNFKLKNIATPPKISPCKSQSSVPTPEKQSSIEKFKSASPAHSASPVKKFNTNTHAVEQMLLARVNSKEPDTKETGNIELNEKTAKGNKQLVNYWEKLSASSKSGNSNSEEEVYDKREVAGNYSYECEDQGGSESETDSKCEEPESEFNYNTEDCEGETESEFNYNNEITDEYDRETESEFNYNTEITEAYSDESDCESDLPAEDNVFKSPKGFPLASKNNEPTAKSSWRPVDFIEDTCDATSFSDESSYPESFVSTDARSTTETHQSFPSSSCSSVASSYETESAKESDDYPTKSSNGSNSDTPLAYTVSFYRKQKQETRTPPIQSIVRRELVASPSTSNQTEAIQEQIKLLQEEILRHQTVIGQTSQALNLCHATAEFSGSSEQVEGERLLLIATQKRQALMNEIQRLKTHGAEGNAIPDGTGTLTISDLQLPLKQEFLAAQLEGRINNAVHWFLCLIRYGAQVIVTQMVSTDEKVHNGALCFTNHIKLQNLPPDFSVVFEVYALQTEKEKLPHEKKYHIKRDKSSNRLTPKSKKGDNKLLMPSIASPGGPNAVRSPSFGVIGFTRFTIQSCNKKCFTLDKIPFSSPLEGVLRVKLHLHTEHKIMEKGFLTMFEDISGFGAWHRRWCALNAEHLTYWKYPDDEQRKAPIGSIELKQCITAHVKPVSRDICARPHTFQLVTVRPQAKGDKNTLISQCVNTMTTTKHLLSADTKEERILWCDKLNEALTAVRKWDPQAMRAVGLSTEC